MSDLTENRLPNSEKIYNYYFGFLLSTTHLLRIEVEYFGSVCASDGHKAHRVHFPLGDAFLPHNGHAVLHAVHALRDFSEVVPSQGLLLRSERAVVTSAALQVITEEKMARNYGEIIEQVQVTVIAWSYELNIT